MSCIDEVVDKAYLQEVLSFGPSKPVFANDETTPSVFVISESSPLPGTPALSITRWAPPPAPKRGARPNRYAVALDSGNVNVDEHDAQERPVESANTSTESNSNTENPSTIKAKRFKFFKGGRRQTEREDSLNSSLNGSRGELTLPPSTRLKPRESTMESFEEEDLPDLKFLHSDGVLVLNDGQAIVRAGTVERLVERLAYEKYPDPAYMQAFMLTYRAFGSPRELMTLLFERYSLSADANLNEEEMAEFKRTQQIIRLRVFNALKYWVAEHSYDFDDDGPLVEYLLDFVENTMAVDMDTAAAQLKRNIKKMVRGEERSKTLVMSEACPNPILPKRFAESGTLLDFVALDPLEMARQLTIIESRLFKAIRPRECVNKRWSKSENEAPGLIAMAKRFNMVSQWVAAEVLNAGESVKARAAIMRRFIQVSVQLRTLNNFNGVMAIMSGLHSASIHRLKKTWEALGKSTMSSYREMEALTNNAHNYKTLREQLNHEHPPIVPYVGVFLTDLTFIEDGMKDTLDDDTCSQPLVNFVKLRKIAVVIQGIQMHQNTPFNLHPVPALQDYFIDLKTRSEEENYALSLQYEPRT